MLSQFCATMGWWTHGSPQIQGEYKLVDIGVEARGAAGKPQLYLCFSDKTMQERLIYSMHIHNNHM